MENDSINVTEIFDNPRNIINQYTSLEPNSHHSDERRVEYLHQATPEHSWATIIFSNVHVFTFSWHFDNVFHL